VVKGLSHNADEIIEYFTIINFAAGQNKPLKDIVTKTGENLVDFHRNLFAETKFTDVQVVDETEWVDKHSRDNIHKQYKHMLALLCVHGIMLESYTPDEYQFVQEVVYPAFTEIEKEIGIRPLIVEHIPPELEVTRNWESYPSVFYKFLKKKIA